MVSFPALAQTPATGVYRYKVKPNDTFSVLTAKYLVAGKNWRALQSLTRVRDPRRLPTGLEIAIPMAWLRYTNEPARLASFRGAVTVDWQNKRLGPSLGMAVAEGASIATGPNSFATLVLADQSKVTLPSQTTIKVLSLRRLIIGGSVDYRFKLEQGKVQTQVSPVAHPYGRYHIDTPTILTAVRGTEYRLSFDAAALAASAEILEGTVQIAPEAGSPTQFVERSKGVVTSEGALITYDLLPAPGLRDPGKLQTDDTVIFQLDPIPGAARYHAVLAADAGFVETFAETVSEEPTIDLGALPDGTNFLKVSAIASNGLEGQEQSYAFRRVLASIHPGPVDRDNDRFRFRWYGAGAGERRYRFQLVRGEATNIPIVDQVGLVKEEASVMRLRAGTYLWRIGLTQTSSDGPIEVWTPYREFIIGEADRISAKKAK
ncbi:MAG: FecR domain-containing protein [Alphaproteobacteria bacterium]|nr:FecR domain-containing protein [Alphaproteobacteria bacterium]MBU0876522.1 FecR domain-containing protein [Alphaproteobacteria bacterium]MBU1770993.1 FecR domain-containing protein [Alphaproteobacteria bacterium]